MMSRGLGVHLGLLVCGLAAAAHAWLRETSSEEAERVLVWDGRPERVERVEYTSEQRSVVLEAKEDAAGRYFSGMVEREKPKRPPAHGHAESESESESEANEAPIREKLRFVAVGEASALVEKLAPLKALRGLGRLDPARDAEFGFGSEKPARFALVIGGERRELLFGGKAPGDSDVYVRASSGETFVLDGQIARDLESAESRLMERNLNAFEDDAAVRVRVKLGERSRELWRAKDKKSFWSDTANSEQKDETASNWMDKLGRLRVVEYPDPARPEPAIAFEVEYLGSDGKPMGRLSLGSRPTASGDEAEGGKPEFLVRTEHTRAWGLVLPSSAEQLAQDVVSLIQE